MYCLQKAVSDEPDRHAPDWQESGVVPKSVSPVHASPSSHVVASGTPRQPGANCVLLIATIPQ
jgi:hypothetical protein